MQRERTPESIATSRAFGQRVKEARKSQGLSSARFQERLAEHGVRFDTSAVTRLESGEREPRLTEALAIADVLSISLTDLTAPTPAADHYADDIRRLAENSRKAVLELLRAIDSALAIPQREGVAKAGKGGSGRAGTNDA